MERKLLRVREVGKLLGVGKNRAYELVGTGAIESVIIGQRRFVPPDAVDRYIERLQEKAQAAAEGVSG